MPSQNVRLSRRPLIGTSHINNPSPLSVCSPPPNVQGGGKATRIAPMSSPTPPNVQGKAGGGGKETPVPSKRSPPPNMQGGGAGGDKATPIPSKKSLPPSGGGGKATPLAPMCSPPPHVQGEGGSGDKATPIPSPEKQGGVGGGGKVAPIAPTRPPPPNVQGGRGGGAGEGVGGSMTGAVNNEGEMSGASTTYTCSWKRVLFLLAILVLAGDRLRLVLETTTRGWTED